MSKNLRDFSEAVYSFDAVVRRTAASDWQNSTPCDGWNATQLLHHQCAVLNGVAEMARTGAMAAPTPPEDGDQQAVWAATRDGLLEALDSPGVLGQQGPFWFDAQTIDDVIGVVMWDAAAHTWDLAQATGQPHCLSDELAQACYDAVEPMSDMLVETKRTAARLPIAADAPIVDRYLALVGRSA